MALILLLLVATALTGLYVVPLSWPALQVDDFQILARSHTAARAWENMWVPANEHAMPWGRLSTWLVVRVAGTPTRLPAVAGLQGFFALLLGMGMVAVLVRREFGQAFPGYLAGVLFGLTAVYGQAVSWFAASFAVLALDTILLGLLACQRWCQRGGSGWLVAAAVACAAAPGWFAIGILGGPLCGVYLIGHVLCTRRPRRWRHVAAAVVPSLGTAAFLAVSLPRTAEHIMHLEHYAGQTAVEAFDPLVGLSYSARAVVDGLLVGAVGGGGVALPWPLCLAVLVVSLPVAWWWLRRSRDLAMLLLGVALILGGYLLQYSARAGWPYEQVAGWSRYHLLPHLGLTLLFVTGLHPRLGHGNDGRLSPRGAAVLGVTILVLFVVHLPHGVGMHLIGTPAEHRAYWQSQQAALHRIEVTDALCRQHRIAAEAAVSVLEPLEIPGCAGRENGWTFLTGSPTPLDHDAATVRRLLNEP